MPPISFKASLITSVDLKKKRNEKSYRDCRANLVELSSKNEDDKLALAKIACDWEHEASGFTYEVYNEILKDKLYPDVKKEHYYAITTQKRRFEKLEPEKILGVALFSEKKDSKNELNWLQVHPKNNSEYKQSREYKRVGDSIIHYIQKTFSNSPIYVQSGDSAVGFYKNNGFKPNNEICDYKLTWQA